MKPIVIYVDDDRANLETFKRVFRFDYQVETALSGSEGLDLVRTLPEMAVIVSDQRMPKMTGVEFLEKAMAINPYAQRIMLTAFTDNEALLKAITQGHVFDYVVKPWNKESLKPVIDKAIEIYEDRIEKIKKLKVAEAKNKIIEEEIKEAFNFEEIIGAQGGLSHLMQQVTKIAPTDSSVLIRGESGTGKELVARAIHFNSSRADKAFVKVNSAALTPNLLESELFGHEKGAFTGAHKQKKGRFELADGGTLFLDEIGDLPENVQVKILRILQEKEFERVGGVEVIKTDIRLISATHQNLEKLIQEKKFREDLFFRINVIPLEVPSLRNRLEDIPDLVTYFSKKFGDQMRKNIHWSIEAINLLAEYDWPGNVRELSNVVERAVVLADDEEISPDHLAQNLVSSTQILKEVQTVEVTNLREDISRAEARNLATCLKRNKGNISAAARELNLPRSTLVHQLKKFGLL
jgi:DNA-binding NtrC family response regulator